MVKSVFRSMLWVILLTSIHVVAQQSVSSEQPETIFKRGEELFQLNRFGSARQVFSKYLAQTSSDASVLQSEASFYIALCAKELENSDADFLLKKFIEEFQESNKVPYAYYHLGDIPYAKEKYRNSIRFFEKVDADGLDTETRLTFWFKFGFAYFQEKNLEEASVYFLKVKSENGKYQTAALYYYSHVQYEKGHYETALKGFLQLSKSSAFSKVAPYYIAQIYYLQKEFDKVIDYGTPLIDDSSFERRKDMARIVGDAWYAKRDYAKAVDYLKIAIGDVEKPSRKDCYHLGFSYYNLKDYTNASKYLSMVTKGEDELAQNAYYHLGDCYLKLDDKKRARVAFEAASKLEFDKVIQEDASFNNIKLNYELSYSPFNEIIDSFLSFIEQFPESDKIDEAYTYLSQAFLNTKNYKEALKAIKQIKLKDAGVYRALQKVSFYRGLELFNDSKFSESVLMFTFSLQYAEYNKAIKVKSFYWRAEAKYRLDQYEKAIEDYDEFIHTPGSYKMDEFNIAHYNIGYAYFKMHEYNEAQSWLRKYIKMAEGDDKVMTGDALNRIGDCYYVERDFQMAINYYDKASVVSKASPDYSLFQKAFCKGLLKDNEAKISILDGLIKSYPSSNYVDDALYESARAYVELSNLREAIYRYKTIKQKYPRSSYAKKSMLQLGLVYYNNGDYDNSMAFYKRVVNEFPASQEAKDALMGIRNVYLDQNNLDGYVKYTESLGSFARIDVQEQDSLTFISAERYYMNNDCELAIRNFENYLTAYPQGRFVLNVHFYNADCLYRSGDKNKSLDSYEFVVNAGKNIFTEEALVRTGEIYFGMEKFDDALASFNRLKDEAEIASNILEAKIGIMRCLNKLQRNDLTIVAADDVLKTSKLSPEIEREAHYYKAKSLWEKGQKEEALVEYSILALNTKSLQGAEAKYMIAKNKFDNAQLADSEAEVFDFANKGTPHQYWLAKSFILLSDIYISRNEDFQARQYLESVKENYSADDDILPVVNSRLADIKKREAASIPEAASIDIDGK